MTICAPCLRDDHRPCNPPEPGACECADADHHRCDICGDPMADRDCEDRTDHCTACRDHCLACAREDARWEAADEFRAALKEGWA